MKKVNWIVLLLLCLPFAVGAQSAPNAVDKPGALTFSLLDTLQSKRGLLSTAVYQGEVKLRPKSVLTLYQEDAVARRRYKTGRALLPVGPLVSLAGIGLTAIALKGTPDTGVARVDGQRIDVEFISRSRVKLAAGLGLFLGGIVLVEAANELIGNSVIRFNNNLKNKQAATLNLGITPSGGVGMYVRF